MRVSIPDDLYDQLRAIYKTPQATEAAVSAVASTLPHLAKGRIVVVTSPELAALEALLGSGAVSDGPDLVRKVRNLASFSVGHVTIDFDASDIARLQQRAARRDVSVEAYLRVMLDRFKEEWLMIGEPVALEQT